MQQNNHILKDFNALLLLLKGLVVVRKPLCINYETQNYKFVLSRFEQVIGCSGIHAILLHYRMAVESTPVKM